MRIMLDTNVLISMILFPGNRFTRMLEYITQQHTLVLSSFVVDELLAVADRKFPTKRDVIDRFLSDHPAKPPTISNMETCSSLGSGSAFGI